jgi:ABC-2 type transport system ATP-binding protein
MQSAEASAVLCATRLHKRYGAQVAIESLDLAVRSGDIYALLGPNGAGKTTTLSCFLGFIRPDGGQALVAGIDPAAEPLAARRALAYIPEQVNLYGAFSGLENLAYFAELGGRRYGDEQLRAFLREAGLQAEAHDRRASTYSKGMRQKVGIAIALAREAQALILDEPTSGLDPSASVEFSRLLVSLAGRGIAILMATHDLFRAADIATRVGIMCKGRLIYELEGKAISSADLERLYLQTLAA